MTTRALFLLYDYANLRVDFMQTLYLFAQRAQPLPAKDPAILLTQMLSL